MSRLPVYLDYNATTPVAREVAEAMAPYWTEEFYNPSSGYPEARRVRRAVEEARARVADLLGAPAEAVRFTSGGTESDNWALRGALAAAGPRRRRLVISAVEHPAVAETAAALAREGVEVAVLPVDERGVVRVDALDAVLDERTALVSVMLANNEVGVLQPVAAVARRAHAVGALVHTDAAQAVGKIPVDVQELQVDLLTVAGHKLYGPKGVGALYVRPGILLPPLLAGGGQEGGWRSGTENVPGVVGLGAAARLAQAWLREGGPERQARLRDELERLLRREIPDLTVFGESAPRLPNTSAVAVPGWTGAEWLDACPEVRASTGSAGHTEADRASPTLRAMGVSPGLAAGLVRLSLGRETEEDDVRAAAACLARAARSRR